MAFNIGGGGQSRPYLKFNAKSGRYYVRNGTTEEEIDPPTLYLDLGKGQSGWFRYREGQTPSRVIDPSIKKSAPQPDKDHKRGIIACTLIHEGDGTRLDFATASWHACQALSQLHDRYEDEYRDHQGQVPVVRCGKSQPQKDQYGTNYKPVFTITGWVDRPGELPDEPPVIGDEVWSPDKKSSGGNGGAAVSTSSTTKCPSSGKSHTILTDSGGVKQHSHSFFHF